MIKYITHSPEETIELATGIGALLRRGDVIAFRGGLGAGKTTFTRGLAIGAGLDDEVSSPTFALINEYHGALDIYHFDMYRIENADSLETTGFFDYPVDDSVFVIEWSENISEFLPENTIRIEIIRTGDESREIIIEGDERFADIRY